jgi:hypothetical protein
MVSFDIESLYTNIPLREAIEVAVDTVFSDNDNTVPFDRSTFKELLELSLIDSVFLFDNKIYQQVDGVAMGSPLAPSLANIFLIFLEKKLFSSLPPQTAPPLIYKRYVDDTFVTFSHKRDILPFFDFLNTLHESINFTKENEENCRLPFLDVSVLKTPNGFVTSVYRKSTYTGLGSHFLSSCAHIFKVNSCKTLIHRAYQLSSNLAIFHHEISFLKNFFCTNGFSENLFYHHVKIFLHKIYKPRPTTLTVPRDKKYISFPFLGNKSPSLNIDLTKCLIRYYPAIDFNFVFTNSFTIRSFFNFKDKLDVNMRSLVVYSYKCPRCNLGCYIGSTSRMLKVRMSEHLGISYRTLNPLTNKENSPISSHSKKCRTSLNFKDFKIIDTATDTQSLIILESLHIKDKSPDLNLDRSSYPLLVG